jgi:hypothetical protein
MSAHTHPVAVSFQNWWWKHKIMQPFERESDKTAVTWSWSRLVAIHCETCFVAAELVRRTKLYRLWFVSQSVSQSPNMCKIVSPLIPSSTAASGGYRRLHCCSIANDPWWNWCMSVYAIFSFAVVVPENSYTKTMHRTTQSTSSCKRGTKV